MLFAVAHLSAIDDAAPHRAGWQSVRHMPSAASLCSRIAILPQVEGAVSAKRDIESTVVSAGAHLKGRQVFASTVLWMKPSPQMGPPAQGASVGIHAIAGVAHLWKLKDAIATTRTQNAET